MVIWKSCHCVGHCDLSDCYPLTICFWSFYILMTTIFNGTNHSHKCTYLFICNILGQSTVNSAQCMIAVSCNKYPYSLSAFSMGALCYYGLWSTVATQCVALPWFYTHIKHLEENRLRISTVTQACHYNSSYMPLLYVLLWSVTNIEPLCFSICL